MRATTKPVRDGKRCALGAVTALAIAIAGCPRAAPPPPPPPPPHLVDAQPANGDFTWSIGVTTHPLRAGAAYLAPGGALEIVLADDDVAAPCAVVDASLDLRSGAERVQLHVSRELDVAYPIGRTISPEMLQLPPLDANAQNGGGRLVPRYALEIESLDLKPGGRVVGHVAWVGAPRDSTIGVTIDTQGEGRFDVPLCAAEAEIDALAKLPQPHDVQPTGALRGRTLTAPFLAARAFGELRRWYGLPPHVTRIELYPDPLADCATRSTSKGTALLVEIDSVTGLGKHIGEREPIGQVLCSAGGTAWDCFGDRLGVRGFVSLSEVDLRVGGHVRGVLAIEGEGSSSVQGSIDVELCAPQ